MCIKFSLIAHLHLNYFESYIQNSRVCLIFNNLGSLIDVEIFSIIKSVCDYLKEKGIIIIKVIYGKLMTSLDMKGFSITFLNIENLNELKDVVIQSLDYSVNSNNWNIFNMFESTLK